MHNTWGTYLGTWVIFCLYLGCFFVPWVAFIFIQCGVPVVSLWGTFKYIGYCYVPIQCFILVQYPRYIYVHGGAFIRVCCHVQEYLGCWSTNTWSTGVLVPGVLEWREHGWLEPRAPFRMKSHKIIANYSNKYHQVPSNTIKYHQVPISPIKHHQVPSSNIRHKHLLGWNENFAGM